MNITHVFGKDSDFSSMSKKSPLSIKDIKHTARMKLKETGTNAPTATYSATASDGAVDYICTADRPFVFIVYDRQLEEVLFTGVYKNPPFSRELRSKR